MSSSLSSRRASRSEALIDELFALLAIVETDMPIFFRTLDAAALEATDESLPRPVVAALYDGAVLDAAQRERWRGWFRRWQERGATCGLDVGERRRRMQAANPLYLPRNYLAQQAIDAATEGDLAPLQHLLQVIRHPYEARDGCESFAARRPEWARHRAGCSALSCSS